MDDNSSRRDAVLSLSGASIIVLTILGYLGMTVWVGSLPFRMPEFFFVLRFLFVLLGLPVGLSLLLAPWVAKGSHEDTGSSGRFGVVATLVVTSALIMPVLLFFNMRIV